MSLLPINRSQRDGLALAAIGILTLGSVLVSVVLTEENVRSVVPQIALPEELERVAGGSVTIDAIEINGKVNGARDLAGVVAANTTIDVSGWAVDEHEGVEAAGVLLLIDDDAVHGAYGLPRPDVAAAFKDERYAKSGFHVRIERGSLRRGPHHFAWGVVARSGIRVYVTKTETLTVR